MIDKIVNLLPHAPKEWVNSTLERVGYRIVAVAPRGASFDIRRANDQVLNDPTCIDAVIVVSGFDRAIGSDKSIYNYYRHLRREGHNVLFLTDSEPDSKTMRILYRLHEVGKPVIFNGARCFFSNRICNFMLKTEGCYIYWHECKDIIERIFIKERPSRYQKLRRFINRHHSLFVSEFQGDFYREHFGVEKCNILCHFIVPPIGQYISQIDRCEQELRAEDTNVVMVGSVQKRKGVDLYSRLADYCAEARLDWKFHWLGYSAIESPDDFYFSQNVNWLTYRHDVGDFLRKSSVFFMSSRSESFPLTICESLKVGLPVVFYKGVCAPQELRDLPACFVYHEYSVDAAFKTLDAALRVQVDQAEIDAVLDPLIDGSGFTARLTKILEGRRR